MRRTTCEWRQTLVSRLLPRLGHDWSVHLPQTMRRFALHFGMVSLQLALQRPRTDRLAQLQRSPQQRQQQATALPGPTPGWQLRMVKLRRAAALGMILGPVHHPGSAGPVHCLLAETAHRRPVVSVLRLAAPARRVLDVARERRLHDLEWSRGRATAW